ncbi:hypothetical protein A2W24_00110 [Microgenomates group bacterium RBG_16_45_19]|nr:MAG: hypothetical protein A2W24_00110 [Microgenomates group bacterium RBG_16_45_19]
METITTTMTSKGQILIPKAYRDALGVKPRQTVKIKLKAKQVIIEPTITVEEMFGFLKAPPISRREQKQIIHQAVLEKFETKEKRSGRS